MQAAARLMGRTKENRVGKLSCLEEEGLVPKCTLPYLEQWGKLFQTERKRAGLRESEVSEKTKIPAQEILDLETGKGGATTLAKLSRIALVIRCGIEIFPRPAKSSSRCSLNEFIERAAEVEQAPLIRLTIPKPF